MNTHDVLADLLARTTCKPGWSFRLEPTDAGTKELVIRVLGPCSRRDAVMMNIDHHFPVPEATYNAKSWRRWVFDCCRRVEDHELGEWFLVGDERPFAPLHGPGEDPYTVREIRSGEEARTRQDGSVEPMMSRRSPEG